MAKTDIDFDGAGRLWVEDGRVRFEGNATEAARILFDSHLKPMCEAHIENRLKGTPGYVPGGAERAVVNPKEKRGQRKGETDG